VRIAGETIKILLRWLKQLLFRPSTQIRPQAFRLIHLAALGVAFPFDQEKIKGWGDEFSSS